MDEIYIAFILFFAGVAASFINMMAGGGSMITIGSMIMLGIDPQVANATNRIGVLVGTGTGAAAFKSEKFTDLKTSLLLGLCAIPGAILGAIYSINITSEQFQKVLAIVMILIIITMFIPKKKREQSGKSINKFLIYPAMVLVGIYGGFIQVGVGFLLMAALRHLMSYDLIRVNMHKVFVVLIYTIPVLVLFGLTGKINWMLAIVMSCGNALGSWISVKLSIKKGEKFVKIVLAVAIVLMAVKLLVDI
ncbi:MAG: sulfite exporter TauE/SafE family protein [Bacteroidales bacterium]|nr:sulfite exporter TauE/SafE family protein [Bacteroidales bacterium]